MVKEFVFKYVYGCRYLNGGACACIENEAIVYENGSEALTTSIQLSRQYPRQIRPSEEWLRRP